MADWDRWVNAVIEFQIPLDVSVDAPAEAKVEAAVKVFEKYFDFEVLREFAGTISFEDVEDDEPIKNESQSQLWSPVLFLVGLVLLAAGLWGVVRISIDPSRYQAAPVPMLTGAALGLSVGCIFLSGILYHRDLRANHAS
jgi:hypothetical protein